MSDCYFICSLERVNEWLLFYMLINASKWVIADKHKLSNVSAISWREQFYIQWNDDDVRFVLHQHA
jgi:hypothetical protein